MTKIEYLVWLLVKAERELEEVRAYSHPFRAEFISDWRRRVAAVRTDLAGAHDDPPSRPAACPYGGR
jgi:hypothetical protein